MKNSVSQWGSWDIKSLNGIMNLQHLMEIKIGVYDDFQKSYVEDMHPHKHVNRYGLHAPDGSYFEIEYKTGDFLFTVEFASLQDKFAVKLTPKNHCADLYYYISAHLMWNAYGSIQKEKNALILSNEIQTFCVTASVGEESGTKYYFNAPGLLLDSSEPVYLFCNLEKDLQVAQRMLQNGRNKVQELTRRHDPENQKAVDAICKVMTWNTVFDPFHNRIITPVTRLWCLCDDAEFSVFGCHVLFCWDTFFNGLLAAEFNKELAYQQIYTILSEATDRGMIPNTNAHRKKSLDRSQPPVGSFCVWKLYEKFGEKDLLERSFDALYRWNRYWFQYRDGNRDGLLEWGSDPYPQCYRGEEYAKLNYSYTLAAAKLESGLDNSPMYDDARFDACLHTMDLCDVGLNSLYALDLLCLSKIADALGKKQMHDALIGEYFQMKRRMNDLLWNEEQGIYCNRFWSGKYSSVLSPTNFYPMLAGIPDERQTDRMVREHLMNEEEFWGQYVLPSVSKKEASFLDDKYWRGRIWAPMNYLVFEALLASNRRKEARMLAEKGWNMFVREWEQRQIISENYHADGRAADDPFYTWGALLVYCKLCIDGDTNGNLPENA